MQPDYKVWDPGRGYPQQRDENSTNKISLKVHNQLYSNIAMALDAVPNVSAVFMVTWAAYAQALMISLDCLVSCSGIVVEWI